MTVKAKRAISFGFTFGSFFVERLARLPREQPSGTTAELTDVAVAYLDVDGLVGVFHSRDNKGALDEEFVLDKNTWLNRNPELDAWLQNLTFAQRAELHLWRGFRHGLNDF